MEDESIEYKLIATDDLKKEVLSFVNSHGGSISIGIEDSGNVVGVENLDQEMLRISNMLRDSIEPDVMMFVGIHHEPLDGKEVIRIDVGEGTRKPYYLARSGIRPSGVYVRQGASMAQASTDQIRSMIKASDGDSFEDAPSLVQDLTFRTAENTFTDKGLRFGMEQMKTLGIVGTNGMYTNLGLLFSDQCPFTIKAAVFRGEDRLDFADRKEFGGSILEQLDDGYAYLELNNPVSADFDGLYRKDRRRYPSQALREALLNCIEHRDYSYSASTFMNIFSNRIELVSVGGIVSGLQERDIFLGISMSRNKALARIFYRLGLVEAYGTGLPKIFEAYRNSIAKPEVQTGPNSFKVILPAYQEIDKDSVDSGFAAKMLDFVDAQGKITRAEAEKLLDVGQATAARILKQLVDAGMLDRVGSGPSTRYVRRGA